MPFPPAPVPAGVVTRVLTPCPKCKRHIAETECPFCFAQALAAPRPRTGRELREAARAEQALEDSTGESQSTTARFAWRTWAEAFASAAIDAFDIAADPATKPLRREE